MTFDWEAWPPPEPTSTLLDAPSFVAAGPSAAVRGASADAMMKRAHFHEPHLYLWQLAVAPRAQRSGAGRTLLERVIADASDAALSGVAPRAYDRGRGSE